MSLNRVLQILMSLGLSKKDAQVFVYITAKGSTQVNEIVTGLSLGESRVYRCVRGLRKKGIITVVGEHPMVFSAIPLEDAIDFLSKPKRKSTQSLENNRKRLLLKWQTITENSER